MLSSKTYAKLTDNRGNKIFTFEERKEILRHIESLIHAKRSAENAVSRLQYPDTTGQ